MKFKTNNIEAAYAALGREPIVVPAIPNLPEQERKWMQDNYDLTVVVEAINQESNKGKHWVPNFEDGSTKYEGWYWLKKDESNESGFVFSHANYDCTDTNTDCGARFVYHSLDAKQYVYENFNQLLLNVLSKRQPK